jgi:phenylpropionate dioxygenase-like ring-hydroxylating dioxygenase large terminal subunit
MSYIQQAWYVAAFGPEIGREPLYRMLLGQPVVLYRTQSGTAVALGDVCPHRRAPLHRGKLYEDNLACPYHGLRFDPTGACVHNPNFNNPPPSIRAKSFPVAERDDMVWVWMGDPADADPSTVLSFNDVVASERVTSVQGYLNIRAAEPLISDNLLDLSHAEFLHPYLANPGFNTRLLQTVRAEGDSVLSLYAIKDEPLTPILAQLWEGVPIPRADMRFQMRWNPPSCLLLEIGATMPGHDKAEGVTAWVSHLLTPETETSTHYFWAFARNSKLQDQTLSAQLREGISQAFMAEDAPIIEWQQRYDTVPGQLPMRRQTLPGDAGGARARRIVERLREAEQRRHAS